MPLNKVKSIETGEILEFLTRLVTKNTNYTFVLADAVRTIVHSSDSNHVWTIPPQSTVEWPNGVKISFAKNGGSGTVTITRGSGVTLYIAGTSTDGDIVLPASKFWSSHIFKIADNVWILEEDSSITLNKNISDIAALANDDGNFIVGDGSNFVAESGATARASLGLTIGTDVQAWDAQLDDIAALAVTDGNIIVGNNSNWVAESGATARTSLGLGTSDDPTFADLTLTGFKSVTNNFGAVSNFSNTIGTQSAPDFLYNDATKKFYCRSIIIAEEDDTSEIAIRRVNGTLTSPTAVLAGELSGVIYWQPWIATDWGSGSPNYGRTGQIQSRLTEPTPTRTDTGGNVGIGVTLHGSDEIRERFWVNHDGDVVVAGQVGDAGHAGVESTVTSYPATLTVYSQDTADHATCAWRHDDDISEGFDWDITQATNVLTLLRVLSDARTSILTVDGSGINGVIGATTAAAGTFTAATIDNITIDGSTISCATGSNLEIVPFAGQNIRLDNTIIFDGGVITGATSITSTAFVGTLSTAAQPNITSLGTLTTLTVDNITINGAVISSDTGAISFSDEDITTTGQVNAANFSSSSTVVGDDSVTSFTTVSGAIMKIAVGGSPANGRPNGFVKIEASELPYTIALERTTNIAFSTSVLNGTTGADGNVTISVNGTTCYIENRSGGTQVYDITLFSR